MVLVVLLGALEWGFKNLWSWKSPKPALYRLVKNEIVLLCSMANHLLVL